MTPKQTAIDLYESYFKVNPDNAKQEAMDAIERTLWNAYDIDYSYWDEVKSELAAL